MRDAKKYEACFFFSLKPYIKILLWTHATKKNYLSGYVTTNTSFVLEAEKA